MQNKHHNCRLTAVLYTRVAAWLLQVDQREWRSCAAAPLVVALLLLAGVAVPSVADGASDGALTLQRVHGISLTGEYGAAAEEHHAFQSGNLVQANRRLLDDAGAADSSKAAEAPKQQQQQQPSPTSSSSGSGAKVTKEVQMIELAPRANVTNDGDIGAAGAACWQASVSSRYGN